MQNKSAIWVFTILLALACIYQLSFTLVTSVVEGDADTYSVAKLDSLRDTQPEINFKEDSVILNYREAYLKKIGKKEVYPVFGHTYDYCKKREINLGLDLQGGMNVTLEVSVVELIQALAGQNAENPEFKKAIIRAKQMRFEGSENFVELFGKAYEEVAPGTNLAAIFSNYENKEKFGRDDTNDEVLAKIREEADEAIKRVEQVLGRRIDNMGVVQPKIQRQTTTGRIIIELPGVKNPTRIRRILQGTAKLEFWETYSSSEILQYLGQVNTYLVSRNKAFQNDKKDASVPETSDSTSTADPQVASTEEVPATTTDSTEAIKVDDGGTALDDLVNNDGTAADTTDSAANGNKLALTDAERRLRLPWFSIAMPPADQATGQAWKSSLVSKVLLSDTAEVNRILRMPEVLNIFPRDMRFRWAAKAEDNNLLDLHAIKLSNSEGKAPLEGDVITNARVVADALGNPEVSLTMNATGAEKWATLTGNNVDRAIAIVLDDVVYSAPNVNQEIKGGVSSIAGGFTSDEANDLANVLKAGKLPAPAKIIEEAIVGPTLGKEAVRSGLTSFFIALLIVLAYMFFYYNRAGGIADIALMANLFFVMGVLSSLEATLTLPGIAGIVLTIGMSVDANVLIYERIREELLEGKGLRLAIVDGYKNAYSSVIDANLTTLITGIVLYLFGTGPIKGFATTLIIGIITSLFSAIFITRLLFEWRLNKNADIPFGNKWTNKAFRNLALALVSKRKLYYIVSGIIIVVGIGSLVTRNLDYGVDFTGGRSYIVRFDQPVVVGDLATVLGEEFPDENGTASPPEVKTYGESSQVKVTTNYLIYDDDKSVDKKVESQLQLGLDKYNATNEVMSSVKVEPSIADDVRTSAIWAIVFSLLGIFLYIWLRFRKWQFGLGALVALFHDVLVVLGLFSLLHGVLPFSLEVDQAFIAAVLTVVGYSINDTVVVFDRIREYLGRYKRKEYYGVVNDALNSTLSRTINTSLSTFIVLLIIFIFGGEVIQGFVFALMIGVAVGTYSSICVATPVMVDLGGKREVEEEKKK